MCSYLVNGAPNVPVAEPDGHGYTAMWMAARNGLTQVVRELFEAGGAAVLAAGDPLGGTPLMAAAAHGHLDCVKYLTEIAGANSVAVDSFGQSAATAALDMGHDDVVEYFKSRGLSNGAGGEAGCSLM